MNQNILDEIRTKQCLKKILDYTQNWICYVDRLQTGRISKLMVNNDGVQSPDKMEQEIKGSTLGDH
jgi:hypothetical protein